MSSTQLTPGRRVVSASGLVFGTIRSEVDEYGNVLVEWDDGMSYWAQADLVKLAEVS